MHFFSRKNSWIGTSHLFQTLIFVFLFAFFTGCDGSIDIDGNTISEQRIAISKENLNSYVSEVDIYDTVEFVPIDVPDSVLIGEIVDIKRHRDFYYTLDQKNQSIYQFDLQWNFKAILNKQGGGPEEYNEIFNFNFYDNSIAINDLWRVNHYSLNNFQFIASFQKNYPGFMTYVTNDGHIINHQLNSPFDDTNYNITIYNYLNDSITQRSHPIPEHMKDFTFSQKNHFYSSGENEFFIPPFSDTIYKVNHGKFEVHRVVDFGNKRLDIMRFKNQPIRAADIVNSGEAYFIGDYLMSDTFELLMFSMGGKRYKYQIAKNKNLGVGYSSLKQEKSVLMIPLNYYTLDNNSLLSFKNIEEAQYELEVLKERSQSLPLEVKNILYDFEEKIKKADGVAVKISLKSVQ